MIDHEPAGAGVAMFNLAQGRLLTRQCGRMQPRSNIALLLGLQSWHLTTPAQLCRTDPGPRPVHRRAVQPKPAAYSGLQLSQLACENSAPQCCQRSIGHRSVERVVWQWGRSPAMAPHNHHSLRDCQRDSRLLSLPFDRAKPADARKSGSARLKVASGNSRPSVDSF